MNKVEDEEEKSKVLIVGIADNSFKGPAECIKLVLDEMRKVGHTAVIYTYLPDDEKRMADLKVFLTELGLKDVVTRDKVEADVYFDDKNFSNDTDWYSLFKAFLAAELLPRTNRNGKLLADFNFWQTGKEGSVLDLEKRITPKIILPGQDN